MLWWILSALALAWIGCRWSGCCHPPHPVGGGWVSTEHGKLAVPVPAVIELWEMGRVPVFSNGVEAELVTPTGAALAVALAEEFGPCPPMRVEKVGRGAGAQELPIPNVFRLWIGEADGGELTENGIGVADPN
jgi:uncharacterized protein (DUF111 family)